MSFLQILKSYARQIELFLAFSATSKLEIQKKMMISPFKTSRIGVQTDRFVCNLGMPSGYAQQISFLQNLKYQAQATQHKNQNVQKDYKRYLYLYVLYIVFIIVLLFHLYSVRYKTVISDVVLDGSLRKSLCEKHISYSRVHFRELKGDVRKF